MTVLSVIQEAATVLGIEVPTAVFSSTDRELIELQALVNDTAKMIAKEKEWSRIKLLYTLTGDGTTEDFDLPSDFDRLLKNANIWTTSLSGPLQHITSTDEWLGLQVQAFDFILNAWTIYGGQFHIKPALDSGATAQFFYISNLIISPQSGDDTTDFSNDTDSFLLDERLLKLGIIYRWKSNKGLPSDAEYKEYADLRDMLSSSDGGSTCIVLGSIGYPDDAVYAYPKKIDGT